MMTASSLSYDQVPYPSMSHYSTHPDSLATLAVLGGMQPAPVQACRVLELGCADGGNLFPMAYGLPNSQFIGIDLSAAHIEAGQVKLQSIGLPNVSLRCLDILDIGPELGTFDYIIAHGVYSWVPPVVREKILEICRQMLAPQGVAFISYNTYPGWHQINAVRDLMRYHVREITDPQKRADEARSVLRFYAEALPDEKSAYNSFIRYYSDYIDGRLENKTPKFDSALLHDELEELNQPFYFSQFMQQAQAHGLQYLNDLSRSETISLTPQVTEELRQRSHSIIDLEQSLDFLRNRTFRRTLLCHQEVSLNRKVKPSLAQEFYYASHAQVESGHPDLHNRSVEKFKEPDGATLAIDHPISKAAMLCLAEAWPDCLNFEDLLAAASKRLECAVPALDGQDAQVLGMNLFRAFSYSINLVELHVFAPPVCGVVPERPLVSPVARLMAEQGSEVTNLRHERIMMDDLDRALLPYLDGTHTRAELADLLMNGPMASGALTVEKDGGFVDARQQPDVLSNDLDFHLDWLCQAAIFVDPTKRGGDAHGNG
jgi:methyltransferase-like protein/SAM-dependent methyltransferase